MQCLTLGFWQLLDYNFHSWIILYEMEEQAKQLCFQENPVYYSWMYQILQSHVNLGLLPWNHQSSVEAMYDLLLHTWDKNLSLSSHVKVSWIYQSISKHILAFSNSAWWISPKGQRWSCFGKFFGGRGWKIIVRDCQFICGKKVIPMICTLWIQAIRNKMASDLPDFQKSFLASLKWNISDFRV